MSIPCTWPVIPANARIRHSGERRNPEERCLDSGLRRSDDRDDPARASMAKNLKLKDPAMGHCFIDCGRAIVYGVRGPLAQLVEQLTLNQRVTGSSPVRPIHSTGWCVVF